MSSEEEVEKIVPPFERVDRELSRKLEMTQDIADHSAMEGPPTAGDCGLSRDVSQSHELSPKRLAATSEFGQIRRRGTLR